MKKNVTEVCPGIFSISEKGLSKSFKPPVNIYVICGRDGIIFDAGYGNMCAVRSFASGFKSILRECRARGEDVAITRIIPSHAHADHFAGLKKLSMKYRFAILLTRRMGDIIRDEKTYKNSFAYDESRMGESRRHKGRMRRLIDRLSYRLYKHSWGIDYINMPDSFIDEGGSIKVNDTQWSIIHTPGHSDDHISLFNSSTGVLLSGDNILRSKFTWLGPPRSDIDEYLEMLRKVRDLPGLKVILPGHGSIIENPAERIGEIISYWDNRMIQLHQCIKSAECSGISFKELMFKLYPGRGKMKHEFARGWVMLFLDKLAGEKVISISDGRFYYNKSICDHKVM